MIEHDCNPSATQQPGNDPAARQAGYPVGEERDPDPSALEQGAGRDLTRQPYPGATRISVTGAARTPSGRVSVTWAVYVFPGGQNGHSRYEVLSVALPVCWSEGYLV